MKLNKYMFREYDIRGVYGKDIDEEISYLIGKAFGTKLASLGKDTTIVGYDNRISSPIIEKNVVKGITECGINVVRLGLVTTPMYYYSWDLLNIKCGMMITASHNPKDDNGFKFSYNGIHNAFGKSTLELYDIIEKKQFIESDSLGKCAFDGPQDLVDHQTTIVTFKNGVTASLNMIGGTSYPCRTIHITLTSGEIFGVFEENKLTIRKYDKEHFSRETKYLFRKCWYWSWWWRYAFNRRLHRLFKNGQNVHFTN